MKITQFTDFSFRLLIYLSRVEDRVVTVREIADHHGISAEHLKKVVRSLADLGHIKTVRGKKGGLKLSRAPGEIELGALIRDQENLALLPCFEESCATCATQDCKLRHLVDVALSAFLAAFDGKTLADVL